MSCKRASGHTLKVGGSEERGEGVKEEKRKEEEEEQREEYIFFTLSGLSASRFVLLKMSCLYVAL